MNIVKAVTENEPGCFHQLVTFTITVIKKLLDSIFNIVPVSICRWEIQTYWITRCHEVCVAGVNAMCVYSIMKMY
jgi:hypothetical protein